jgi:hypothetical protein
MADAPKILGTDSLRVAYPKINNAIDLINDLLKQFDVEVAKLIPWYDNFTVSPATVTTGSKTVTFPAGSSWNNNLGANVYIQTSGSAVSLTVPDGSLIALTFPLGTNILTASDFTVEAISGYVPNKRKYVLFMHYDKRLISPIPIYQIKLDKLYNLYLRSAMPEPISRLIPWYDNITISPGTSVVDTESVTFPANSVLSSTTGKYCLQKTQLSLSIPDGSLCYLQWDDSVTNIDLPAGSFVVTPITSFTPAFNRHVLFMNYAGKLISPIPIYQIKIDKIYNGAGANINYKNVIIVAKSGGHYTTIQAAVNAALDSTQDKVTILVMPGVYYESVSVGGSRHISIIGINKLTCIIRDDSGAYANAPLEIQGESYVANLTFISTHDDDSTTPVDSLRSYAVHADYNGAGTTEFNNCIMISYQNAAFGCGLHQDQTVKLVNCELYSHTPAESTMTGNGSLFVHNAVASGVTNQKLIVKGCTIESDRSYAAFINDANKTVGDNLGNDMTVTFFNTVLYSEELGKTGVIRKETPNVDCFSGSIKLTPKSYGNNLAELNA